MSAASFLHSSFLQAINAVMLWPVHVEKVPQASEHLCPAETRSGEAWSGQRISRCLGNMYDEKSVRIALIHC